MQSEDGKSSSAPTGAAPWLGVSAALAAASISGFAGVFLEKMFTSGPRLAVILSTRRERLQTGSCFTAGGTSLWMRNVQLGLFAIPLQCIAIAQVDGGVAERRRGRIGSPL